MEKLLFLLYLFPLFFAPLAFGSIDLWAISLLEVSIFIPFALLLFFYAYQKRAFIKVPALTPLLLFLAWVALQLIPLPYGLVSLISPATAALYEPLQNTPQGLPHAIPLSVHPWYTLQDTFRFGAYIAYYFLTVQLLADAKRMRQTILLVLLLASGIALYGIVQHYCCSDRIFWWRTFDHKTVGATFSYKNHYAAYLAMLLPIALNLFLYNRTRKQTSQLPLKQRIVNLSLQLSNKPTTSALIAALLLGFGLLLSGSRGGIACATLSTLFLFLLNKKRRTSKTLWYALVVVALTLLGTGLGRDGLLSVDQQFGRALEKDGKTLNGRINFWKNAVPIITDFPLTGTGSGTFRAIYPRFLTSAPSTSLPLHAHNDYLETLTNTGVIGAILLLSFFVRFFRQTASKFRHRKDGFVIQLYQGSLAGIVAVLLHSTIDLQFRLSAAVGFYFITLLGIHAASLCIKQHRGSHTQVRTVTLPALPAWSLASGACLVVIVCGIMQLGELRAMALFPETSKLEARTGKAGYASRKSLMQLEGFAAYVDNGVVSQQELCNRATKAIQRSSINPGFYFLRSTCEDALSLGPPALADSRKAFLLGPARAVYAQQLGLLLEKSGKNAATHSLLYAAVNNDPTHADEQLELLQFLLRQNQQEKALRLTNAFLSQQPDRAADYLQPFERSALPPTLVEASLPQKTAPFIALAQWYERKGQLRQAEACYMTALLNLDTGDKIRSKYFWQPLRFFQKQKKSDNILFTLNKAVYYLPKNLGLCQSCGNQEGVDRPKNLPYQIIAQII